MASPQLEDGYTRISNEILEALAKVNLSAHESRCLALLFRKTWGFHKKSDWISQSQFSKGTGLDRRHVYKALKRLTEKNMLIVCRDSLKHPTYCFQKDYEKWKMSYVDMTTLVEKAVQKRERRRKKSIPTYDRVSYVGAYTKDTNTKETIKKEEERDLRQTLSSFFNEKVKKIWIDPNALSSEEKAKREKHFQEERERQLTEARRAGMI